MTQPAVVTSYFDRLLELRPIDASYYGRHKHDARLPAGDRASLEAEAALARELLGQVAEIADPLERELAGYHCQLSLFQIEEQQTWRSFPDAAEAIGAAIFLLFARDFAPLPQRLESIAARLEDTPRYLKATRELVEDPVDMWCRIGLETTRQLPGLVEVVIGAAAEGSVLRRRLAASAGPALAAFSEHAAWIEQDLLPAARPQQGLGEAGFERLLRLRRLPDSPDAILALGHRYLEEVKEQREELAARHWPGRSVEEVQTTIKSETADFGSALENYRKCIASARRFVVDRRLATVPDNEVLEVVETPAFLRPVIPFAAYEPAAYFDPKQHGIYLVTPPPDPAGPAEKSHADILNTSVHEGYPGHHLQFACGNRHPSLIRLLAGQHATEFIEGWAHYCEQLMYEEGFSQTPQVRFIQLTDLIWRACRVIIDVELSQGRLGFEPAVAMLMREAGMDHHHAEAEVKRYTYTPGYQLSYLYGKHLLLELRERERRRQGPLFTLLEFHDRLLYAGALPAALWTELFPDS